MGFNNLVAVDDAAALMGHFDIIAVILKFMGKNVVGDLKLQDLNEFIGDLFPFNRGQQLNTAQQIPGHPVGT